MFTNESEKNDKNNNDESLTNLNKKISTTISLNIRDLLRTRGMSQESLCKELAKHGINISQSNLSKYIPQNKPPINFSVGMIFLFCKIFNITFEDIITPNLINKQDSIPTSILNYINTTNEINKHMDFAEHIAIAISKTSNKFIIDVNDDAFNGYCQRYYSYMYPTVSSEKNVLTGELTFSNVNGICKSSFKLATGYNDKINNPIYKHYEGIMVIAEKIHCCYCILSSVSHQKVNELCFLNFRYIPISDPNRLLDCRMIEVLTTSAGGDSSFPTTHRMFISRTQIKSDDLTMILPHLYLNNSTITIEEDELVKVASFSENYAKVIKRLILLTDMNDIERNELSKKMEVEPNSSIQKEKNHKEREHKTTRLIMLVFKEDLVRSAAYDILAKQEVYVFISYLRIHSYTFRYNKTSKKLDDNVRKALRSSGYYKYGSN